MENEQQQQQEEQSLEQQNPRCPDMVNSCNWGRGDEESTDVMQVISLVLCFIGTAFKIKILPWVSLVFSLAGIVRSPYVKMESTWFMTIMVIVPVMGLILEYFGTSQYR